MSTLSSWGCIWRTRSMEDPPKFHAERQRLSQVRPEKRVQWGSCRVGEKPFYASLVQMDFWVVKYIVRSVGNSHRNGRQKGLAWFSCQEVGDESSRSWPTSNTIWHWQWNLRFPRTSSAGKLNSQSIPQYKKNMNLSPWNDRTAWYLFRLFRGWKCQRRTGSRYSFCNRTCIHLIRWSY